MVQALNKRLYGVLLRQIDIKVVRISLVSTFQL